MRCALAPGWPPATDSVLDDILPAERAAPMVTVLDGHPHTLSFLGSVRCVPVTCLGVDDFGQSGDVGDLYRHFGIDAATIVGAGLGPPAMTDITMPRLSDSMTEGTILTWLKPDGDEVAEGEELVEIETDKATMTYESPAGGVLTIVAATGETLAVGAVMARTGAGTPQVADETVADERWRTSRWRTSRWRTRRRCPQRPRRRPATGTLRRLSR